MGSRARPANEGPKVTADIPLEDMLSYWLANPDTREQIASRLRAQGIKPW